MILLALLLATAPPPSVDDILRRYEAATGDAAVAREHQTRTVRSTYEDLYGTEAEVFEYYGAPNRYVRLFVRGDGIVSRTGTDGKSVWSESPRGVEVVPAEKSAVALRDAAFNRHLRLRELYPRLQVTGAAKVAGKDAWQVEAEAADGAKEQLYFDAVSGLLVRRTYADANGVEQDFLYEQYTEYGGVLLPSLIRQFRPGAALYRVQHVEHNLETHPIIFAVPPCGAKK